MYQWNFGSIVQYRGVLLDGLLGTAKLAATGLVLALVIGVVVGVAGTASSKPVRAAAAAFVNFFRNIPFIVQLFWFYYTLPVITGIQANNYTAASCALGMYGGAYVAEIVRAGIIGLPQGQWEGARAIGLGHVGAMRYVILPQALTAVIPPMTSQVMEIVKLTTVASTIAYAELLYSAKLVADQEFRPIESYTVVAGALIASLLCFSVLASWLERRLRRA